MVAIAQQKRQAHEAEPARRFPPAVDRLLADRLQGRRICVVVDDPDYARGMKELVSGMLSGGPRGGDLRILNWSTFVSVLPEIRADIVVALSPRDLAARLPLLEEGLFPFREKNPSAIFMVNNLHSPLAQASVRLERLRSLSLIDHVEAGFLFFPNLVHMCADALDAKV